MSEQEGHNIDPMDTVPAPAGMMVWTFLGLVAGYLLYFYLWSWLFGRL